MDKAFELAIGNMISGLSMLVVIVVAIFNGVKVLLDMSRADEIDRLFWSGSKQWLYKVNEHIRMIFVMWFMILSLIFFIGKINMLVANVICGTAFVVWIYLSVKYVMNHIIAKRKIPEKKVFDKYQQKWDYIILFTSIMVFDAVMGISINTAIFETNVFATSNEKVAAILLGTFLINLLMYILLCGILNFLNTFGLKKREPEKFYIYVEKEKYYITEGTVEGKVKLMNIETETAIILEKKDLLGIEINKEKDKPFEGKEVKKCKKSKKDTKKQKSE